MTGVADRKVLVVDDEAPIRGLLRCALAGLHFDIYDAECGASALRMASEHGPFSLVISDVVMPEMDGIALARKLSENGHASTFLFISGFCDDAVLAEWAEGLGASTFLAKPFSIPDLLRAVRSLLGDHRELAAPSSGDLSQAAF
jgi:CheY-like chemotaxis protein